MLNSGSNLFIYRFTEAFNFPNANHHLDYMVRVITAERRLTTVTSFTKPGLEFLTRFFLKLAGPALE